MGMLACYQMSEDKTINELLDKTEAELFEEIEELQEEEDLVLDIDKLWDGLHFLLTGSTAAEPIEGDPLSESVVGVKRFLAVTDYIAYINSERVGPILDALNHFDIEGAIKDFQPEMFAQNGIYPGIWMSEDKEDLGDELKECFLEIRSFYEKAMMQQKGVIVSIY